MRVEAHGLTGGNSASQLPIKEDRWFAGLGQRFSPVHKGLNLTPLPLSVVLLEGIWQPQLGFH